MSKIDNEIYTLTLKGLLSTVLTEKQLKTVIDTIELHMLRHGYNGIVYEDKIFKFITLQKGEKYE